MAPSKINEEYLRAHFGLGRGTEVHLPLDSELTRSAQQLLSKQQIRIKYIDAQGRVFDPGKKIDAIERVHPLTGRSKQEEAQNPSLRKSQEKNPEVLTHLDAHTLVAKDHPRIALRGKLDTLISFTVLAQNDFDRENRFPWLHPLLADIRSHMGSLLRAEVTGEEMKPVTLGGLDQEKVHTLSHNPLKYLGHDHIVPEKTHGRNVAQINVLRALAREVEVEATKVFSVTDNSIGRPDLLKAANRLSSALYVLMILTLLAEQGQRVTLENILLEA